MFDGVWSDLQGLLNRGTLRPYLEAAKVPLRAKGAAAASRDLLVLLDLAKCHQACIIGCGEPETRRALAAAIGQGLFDALGKSRRFHLRWDQALLAQGKLAARLAALALARWFLLGRSWGCRLIGWTSTC